MVSKMNLTAISVFLGKNLPTLQILASAVFVVVLFFYIFTIGVHFHVSVSPLENRINYHAAFSDHIINEFVDNVVVIFGTVLWLGLSLSGRTRFVSSGIYGAASSIAIFSGNQTLVDVVTASSIPILVSFLVYNKFVAKKILHFSSLTLNYLAILGIALGFSGLILSCLPLFSVSTTSLRDYLDSFSLLLAVTSPILILFLILSSPFKLFVKKFSYAKNKNLAAYSTLHIINSKTKILFLVLFMLLSVIIALIPHMSSVNPPNQLVGSDSPDYVMMITQLTKSNPQEFVQKIFVTLPQSSDRPLNTVFLYSIAEFVPASISYTIDHLPILLAPGLVLVIFFLTRELTSNDTTSLLASFITAVSFQTLIGIYSGIYANWLALIIGYLSLVFLVKFLKTPSKRNLLVYSTLLICLVFTHVYTWTILALFSGAFLVAMYKLKFYQKKNIIVLLAIVLSSIAVDLTRTTLTGISGGIQNDFGLASTAGTGQSAMLWANLTDTVQNYAGGLYGNFIIFALGVYWIIRSNSRKLSSIFILIFLAMAVVPLLFGDGIIQSRILYDIPFQIPAAIGLTYLMRRPNGMYAVLPICVWLLAMSIRAVSNFYYISSS